MSVKTGADIQMNRLVFLELHDFLKFSFEKLGSNN
jgi:hypothetical protein